MGSNPAGWARATSDFLVYRARLSYGSQGLRQSTRFLPDEAWVRLPRDLRSEPPAGGIANELGNLVKRRHHARITLWRVPGFYPEMRGFDSFCVHDIGM